MRFLTAGESHGKGLSVIVDDVPAGIPISLDAIHEQMRRRQLGYGRGGRMTIEKDTVEVTAGVRLGKTTGAPVAIWVENRDFANWQLAMASDNQGSEEQDTQVTQKAFYRPRPGHADLAGYYKYGHEDLRDVLERASARETAARVAAGSIARALLDQVGIKIMSHVTVLGGIETPKDTIPEDFTELMAMAEANDFRCAAPDSHLEKLKERVDKARKEGVTLGGEVEIIVTGVPAGLGSYVQWDRKLDGLLAQALMSIQAVKSVTIGQGEQGAWVDGSKFHDEIALASPGQLTRPTNRAGGLEGGVTNGMPLTCRLTMKPISTMLKALQSVNLQTAQEEAGHFERSDVTAVPACGVVGEAMVALVLARVFLDKFGGDCLEDIQMNVMTYRQRLSTQLSMADIS